MSAQTAFAFIPVTRLRRRAAGKPPTPVPPHPDRPRTRDDCRDGPRPCPWVSCRFHLALDVTRAGSIHLNGGERTGRTLHLRQKFGVDDWLERAAEVALGREETCALDVADGGPSDLKEIGDLLSVTRYGASLILQGAIEAARDRKLTQEDDFSEDEGAES